jgi:hypothetical protein
MTLLGCQGASDGDASDAGREVASVDASPRDASTDRDLPVALDASPSDAPSFDAAVDPPGTWRSTLFPRDWLPVHAGGTRDEAGRALPDFGYAGWHRGRARPPTELPWSTFDVTASVADGVTDATSAIQRAIDGACAAGSGIVRLPRGTLRVRLPSGARSAIRIRCSNVVLRGEGADATRVLFDDADRARGAAAIGVEGGGAWDAGSPELPLARDHEPTTSLDLTDPATGLQPGDWVVVRNDVTPGFRTDHRMESFWPDEGFRGLYFPRRVRSVADRRVELDAPTHYALRTRDSSRVYAIGGLSEIGLEDFSIGMVESRMSPADHDVPAAEGDWNVPGTTGYAVHSSAAIRLEGVHDAWIRSVTTFAAEGNASGAHVLSQGIVVSRTSSRVSMIDVHLGRPQYRGGGGNGYLFMVYGHDVLAVDGSATGGRHNLILSNAATGNVFLRMRSVDAYAADDTHKNLSVANLFDRTTLSSAWIQSVNRGSTSGGAGFTGTGLVAWGTHVERNHRSADGCAVETSQWAHGFAIGSSAAVDQSASLCARSFSNRYWSSLDDGAPVDFVEGEGLGERLVPVSLFNAMLSRACLADGEECATW